MKNKQKKNNMAEHNINLFNISLSILAFIVSLVALYQASQANRIAEDANRTANNQYQLSYAENAPSFELISDFESTGIVNIISSRGIMDEAKLDVKAYMLYFSMLGTLDGARINDNYLIINIDDFFVDEKGDALPEAFWQPYNSENGFSIEVKLEQYNSCLQLAHDAAQLLPGSKDVETELELNEENRSFIAYNVPVDFFITYKDLLGIYCTEVYGISDNVLTKVDRYDMLNMYNAYSIENIHIGDYCSYKLFTEGRLNEDPNYETLVAAVEEKISQYLNNK